MQAQSITLVFTEGVEKSLDGRISDQFAPNCVRLVRFRTGIECVRGSIEIDTRVEVPRLEVASAVDCAMVSHLNDPGTAGTFGGIKYVRFAMNKQEDFLKQVVCLGRVSEDAKGYAPHEPRVTTKQASQGFCVLRADLGN